MKILKEFRTDTNSNTDAFKKELETIRRSQEKLEYSFVEMKATHPIRNLISLNKLMIGLHLFLLDLFSNHRNLLISLFALSVSTVVFFCFASQVFITGKQIAPRTAGKGGEGAPFYIVL